MSARQWTLGNNGLEMGTIFERVTERGDDGVAHCYDATIADVFGLHRMADKAELADLLKRRPELYAKPYANALLIAAAPALLEAAKKVAATMKTYIESCDHSVNICFCSDRRELEELEEAISLAEPKR